MKNVKALIIIITIIVIAIIVFATIKFYNKPEYSLQDIRDIINTEIPNNLYLKEESIISKEDSEEKEILEIFKKDNIIYWRTEKQEELCDYENNFQININHEDKKIDSYSINKVHNPLEERLNMYKAFLNSNEYKYKYIGKEEVNGKECIKVLVYDKYSENYFYINLQNKEISRFESYNKKDNTSYISVLTYSYNTVTDENIPEFDINNYPDYLYMEYTN